MKRSIMNIMYTSSGSGHADRFHSIGLKQQLKERVIMPFSQDSQLTKVLLTTVEVVRVSILVTDNAESGNTSLWQSDNVTGLWMELITLRVRDDEVTLNLETDLHLVVWVSVHQWLTWDNLEETSSDLLLLLLTNRDNITEEGTWRDLWWEDFVALGSWDEFDSDHCVILRKLMYLRCLIKVNREGRSIIGEISTLLYQHTSHLFPPDSEDGEAA